MNVVGLDVGGANLKAADRDGKALTKPFAIWKAPERLAVEVSRILAGFHPPDLIAVTMTAELADCYRTKHEGVSAIVDAVEAAAGTAPVLVWQTGGTFVTPQEARDTPHRVAAANWHALATFAGRLAERGPALLIDIGTTTTDIIPLQDGVPTPAGRTDQERLQSGELVYTGIRRTPVCAIVQAVPFRGRECRVAAELFATALNVYLTLGDLVEDAHDCETADGRPATVGAARDRLARCLCCDATEFASEDAVVLSRFVAEAQQRQIAQGVDAVMDQQGCRPRQILLSGSGTFLAERTVAECPTLIGVEKTSLTAQFGPRIAEAACAFAVARLAAERGGGGWRTAGGGT